MECGLCLLTRSHAGSRTTACFTYRFICDQLSVIIVLLQWRVCVIINELQFASLLDIAYIGYVIMGFYDIHRICRGT